MFCWIYLFYCIMIWKDGIIRGSLLFIKIKVLFACHFEERKDYGAGKCTASINQFTPFFAIYLAQKGAESFFSLSLLLLLWWLKLRWKCVSGTDTKCSRMEKHKGVGNTHWDNIVWFSHLRCYQLQKFHFLLDFRKEKWNTRKISNGDRMPCNFIASCFFNDSPFERQDCEGSGDQRPPGGRVKRTPRPGTSWRPTVHQEGPIHAIQDPPTVRVQVFPHFIITISSVRDTYWNTHRTERYIAFYLAVAKATIREILDSYFYRQDPAHFLTCYGNWTPFLYLLT